MENESEVTHKVDIRLRKYGNDHHPRLIMDEVGNRYVAVAITHEKRRGQRKINYRLQRNPLGENRPAYVRRTAEIRKKNQYGPVIYFAYLSDKDYKTLMSYAQKAKHKYCMEK